MDISKMATPVGNFGLLDPYLPSLYQITLIQIAKPMLNYFDVKTLDSILTETKRSNSARLNESILGSCKAKEKLLLIPAHLRHDVLTAVMSMHNQIFNWRRSIDFFRLQDIDCVFYWRWDGLIDKIKTAQHIALNANVSIKQRFEMACRYCLEKNVLSLWSEMEASLKAEYLSRRLLVTYFWANWINRGSRIPWLKALKYHFENDIRNARLPYRYSFFPLLKPEERYQYLVSFDAAILDELRLCMYVFTEKEKMFVLKLCLNKLLVLHLDWPLQSFFLDKFQKVFRFIDDSLFIELLQFIGLYHRRSTKRGFDYDDLFRSLWNVCPQNVRERAEKNPTLNDAINAIFNKMTPKRQSSGTNCEEQVRKKSKGL